MVRRERKFYTEEFKEQVLAAYNNSDESATEIARRFQVNRDTVKVEFVASVPWNRAVPQKSLHLRDQR
jgi:hypothetical protein